MCLYTNLVTNPKYKANKKNGGNVPVMRDKRVGIVPIGCGKCIECRNQERRKWQVRLLEDIRKNTNGKFVTLTFSNRSIYELNKEIKGLKGYELDNEIATIAVHRFRERWRKKYKKSIRHWLITELGHKGTENIHLHGIVWTDEELQEVEKHWKYGGVHKGNEVNGKIENYVNEETVNYITKYVHKIDKEHQYYKPKILTSAGIGAGYLKRLDAERNKFKGEETREYYTTRTGHKMNLPIYYRNAIYTEEEREQLWLQKLDKGIMYVCGEKVDVSENDEELNKLREYHRNRNKRLGYGDNKINWDRKKYEQQRRNLKQQERIAKGGGLWEGRSKTKDSGAGRIQPTAVRRDSAIKPSEENFIKNLE